MDFSSLLFKKAYVLSHLSKTIFQTETCLYNKDNWIISSLLWIKVILKDTSLNFGIMFKNRGLKNGEKKLDV